MNRYFAALLIGLLAAADARACSCEARTLREIVHAARTLLVVRAISIADRTPQELLDRIAAGEVNLDIPEEVSGLGIDFELIRTLKGDASGIKQLHTGYSDADCGLPIRAGDVWLVEVWKDGGVGLCGASMRLGSVVDESVHRSVKDFKDLLLELKSEPPPAKDEKNVDPLDGCPPE